MQFIKIKEEKLTSLIFTIMSCWQKSLQNLAFKT